MTFAILGRTALLASTRRQAAVVASQQAVKRRTMASHAAAPEWTGIDKVVRGYFPQDDQLAAAIIGGYFGLFLVVKIGLAMGGSKEEVLPIAAASSSAAGAIPDVDSEEFGAFLESEENVMKLVESFEK
ncbi:hypothetical protein ACHAWU_010387 [Discostella pseudostelligera]|uniref:Uncharacterized protein n=1 Tax=Discostella pseudostelligera TaxID=259834 RepID=A0ABD3MMB9_9STRA